MKKLLLLLLPLLFSGMIGCPFFQNPSEFFGSGGSRSGSTGGNGVTHQERDVSGKLSVAIGGVASKGDEITFSNTIRVVNVQNEAPDLFSVTPLDGSSFSSSNGMKIQAQRAGIGYVTPITSGPSISPVEITIPPQKLIQVLVGEARGELAREATLESGVVKASSVSITGDAIGAVIRNRINRINELSRPDLFVVNETDYGKEVPISYYEAVIEANRGRVYQFSPVDLHDVNHTYYLNAAQRSTLENLGANVLLSYDQAVLTAAGIFNHSTKDTTGGSFGYFSPTPAQYELIKEAFELGSRTLPAGCGTTDENFPSFAPIQIVVLSQSAPSSQGSQVPAFVFIRSRTSVDPVVIINP